MNIQVKLVKYCMKKMYLFALVRAREPVLLTHKINHSQLITPLLSLKTLCRHLMLSLKFLWNQINTLMFKNKLTTLNGSLNGELAGGVIS